MGYTHYWTQKRDFTKDEWEEITRDVAAILKFAQHEHGVPLANGNGEPGTSPEITDRRIFFNGVREDAHETMCLYRVRPQLTAVEKQCGCRRGGDFCKTARKPYDIAVVAVLCYLATVTRKPDPVTGDPIVDSELYRVTSDGHGDELLDGLHLARKALPRAANELDLPMEVMRNDRWCGPWVSNRSSRFEVRFCVDGHGYVQRRRTGESYRFDTHVDLGRFLETTKRAVFRASGQTRFGLYGREEPDIWKPSGCFDEARWRRIASAQDRVLAPLFPVDTAHAHQPPAFARPNQFPEDAGRERCYYVSDLLSLAAA